LLSMMDFDSKDFGEEFHSKFPEQGAYPDTHVLLLFVASNIARYRPQLWERILEGICENDAKFNKRMKRVYDMIFVGEKHDYYRTFHYQIWAEFLRLLHWK